MLVGHLGRSPRGLLLRQGRGARGIRLGFFLGSQSRRLLRSRGSLLGFGRSLLGLRGGLLGLCSGLIGSLAFGFRLRPALLL